MHKIYTQNLVNLPLDKTPASRACERPAQTKKTEVAYRMALTSVFWSIAGNLAIDIGRISRALQFPTFWRCSSTASTTYLVISAGLSCQLSSLDDTILTRYLIRLSSVSLIFFLLFSVDSKTDRRSTHSKTWLHLLLLQRIRHKYILFFPYSLRLVRLPRVSVWFTFIYRITERPCGELSLSTLVLYPQLASTDSTVALSQLLY